MSKSKNPCKDYKLLEIVGRGKFGTVHKAINKENNQVIAIKILNLDTDHEEVKDIQQEIHFLSNLKSVPNITHYFGSYLNGHKLWILMDYCAGGSVRTLLKPGPLQEKYIAVITRELLIALQFIHEHGVIHRDLKAANILISKDGNVKLCDFGVAAQLTSTAVKRTTMAGTPYWMAPEVITEGATYNAKADIWSTGITIYEMATGNPPYSDKDAIRAMQYITQHEPSRLEGRQYGPFLKEIVAMCLEEKQDVRPTAEDLLKSRFIKSSKSFPTSLLKEVIGKYLMWRDTRNAKTSGGAMRTIAEVPEVPDVAIAPDMNNNALGKTELGSSSPSITDDASIIGEEEEDIKWDFDSLKSAEYIVEHDIDLKNEDHQFDDFDMETNANREFITSPYNRTFTIGNTLINSHMNDTRVNSTMTGSRTGTQNYSTGMGTSAALSLQVDSIINSQTGSSVKVEPPKSLMRLFQTDEEINNELIRRQGDELMINGKANDKIMSISNHKIDYSMANTDEINTGIIDLSIAMPNLQQPHEMRQQIVPSPLVSIEIPNMDVIENEIQEREKQRSRATTLNNNLSNTNSTAKVESLISDQPLPIRKPTLTMSNNRTPSPARGLEQINTALQTSPSKQSSPLHMKPLVTNAQQPLLQPLNNLKMKPQINLANISNHKAMSGPQTAPVTSFTNAELIDSSIRARSQMRIQMPKPVSASAFNFNNVLKDVNNSSKNENSEKNQFGFDVNVASTLPLAMTPVTERQISTANITPEKESNKSTETSNASNVSSTLPSNLSHKLVFSNVASSNSIASTERKMSVDTTSRYVSHSNETSQLRNNSIVSTHDDTDRAADVTLTNENTPSSIIVNTDNMVTGLGMMTMNETGKASPLRMSSSNYGDLNKSSNTERLVKILSTSQMNVNRVTNYGLGISEVQADVNNIAEFYVNEIENLLANMDDMLDLVISELN